MTEAPSETPALGFAELRANVTTGVGDQVRLAAKFAVTRVTGMVQEVAESAKSVWNEEDPATYHVGRYKRGAERLRTISAWAINQEMVPPNPKAPLPHHERPI